MPTTRTFLNLINEIMSIEKSQYNYYINVDRIVVIWIRFFNVKEIDKYLWYLGKEAFNRYK